MKHLILATAGAVLLGSLNAAFAQQWPTKPIRIIACCTGFPETTIRVVASEMTDMVNQPIVIEAKAGANGILGADYVAKQPGDGHTIFIGTNSTHAANQSLYKTLPYDYIKDFIPISGISQGMLVLVTKTDLPAKNIAELTAFAKANPAKLAYGSGSSSSHAAMELYKLLAGIDIRYIPYKTSPQVSVDIVGGRLDMMTSNLGTVQPLIEGGKLRALAVTGKKRAPSLPNVPTMHEAGVTDYELTFWNAAWVPAGTPQPIVNRLNQMFVTALNRPKVKDYMLKSGNVEFPTTSDELMKFQISEHAKWKRIFEAAGVKPQ